MHHCSQCLLLAAIFLTALTQAALLEAAPKNVTFSQSAAVLETYDFVELTLNVAKPDARNPFTDVVVEGSFKRQGGKSIPVDGFCDSQDGSVFRIRFMPDKVGRYSYSVTYRQASFQKSHKGTFRARDGKRRGILRVDNTYPWHFIWEGTGEHYFWNGTTTYYLMGWQDEAIIRRSIDRLQALKVNRLRVLLYGRNSHSWGEPVVPTDNFKRWLNPWVARRPDDVANPGFDLKRFNVVHWQKYERLLRHAREKDMAISVILFIGAQVLPTPFAEGSEDEHRYYRYAVARLAAFSNVTWDLGNEHDFHRKVPQWADNLGRVVKKWDPYDHLTSAHNVPYRTPKSTWADIQLIQRWDAGQNAFMLSQRQQQAATGRIVPQINEEYGYQDHGERYPGQRSAESRRRCAWEIYMAGGYQTTGESARRGTGVPPDTGGGWVNGRGDDTMVMLKGYAHIVDFFTGFDWWKTEPRNDLANNAAFCSAQPGKLYAVYLPNGGNVTVKLRPGSYRAKWFNPRTGGWVSLPPANGPVWTSPDAPDNGDWALLLQSAPSLSDTTPPSLRRAAAGGDGNKVIVTFSEVLDRQSAANRDNYAIDKGVSVKAASVNSDMFTVTLSTSRLSEGVTYSLTVNSVKDRAPRPNTIAANSRTTFRFTSALAPIVELRFNENRGKRTANTGTSSARHPFATLKGTKLAWSTNSPPGGGASALDFGSSVAECAADLTGGPAEALKSLKSFTITGWVNCRKSDQGSGGNRIVTTINNGGDGFDLVFLRDGRAQIGINQWPDGVPAKSSPRKITVDPKAKPANWRFFAVTYDSTLASNHVKFYFGRLGKDATFDRAITYDRGPVGFVTGPELTVGHFNTATRSRGAADRIFRGLIDEIRVYGSRTDGSGALTLKNVVSIQKIGRGSAAK